MAGDLTNVRLQYKINLQDATGLVEAITGASDVRDGAINAAVGEYSRRIPLLQTLTIAGNSTGYYLVPAGWLDPGSRLVSVENPLDIVPPAFFSPKSWQYVRKGNGVANLFYLLNPNPQGNFRMTWIGAHTLADDATNTVPASHEPAIGKLAAYYGALALADYYAQTAQSGLDSVNYRSKSKEWKDRADALRKAFEQEIRRDEIDQMRLTNPYTYSQGWT